jgi:putative hemolysin
MHITFEVLVILLLLGANGLLAMSEIAVVSARKPRLQRRAEAGEPGARRALELANDPNRFLSTVQIGITTVGILAGAFGGATIAQQIAGWVAGVEPLARYAQVIGIGSVVVMITYATLVLGELAPKRFALSRPERIAARIAGPMHRLSLLATPLVRLLGASTDLVLRLLPAYGHEEPAVTEEDVRVLLEQGTRAGVFLAAEQDIVENVFWLGDQKVEAVMTPRDEIVWLDIEDSADSHLQAMLDAPRGRYIIGKGALDNVVGAVAMKDIWPATKAGAPLQLRSLAFMPLFVPQSTRALTVLEQFRKTGIHVALVHDENDRILGLVTMTDILEGLVGELAELAEDQVVQREDGSWLVSASVLMEDVHDLLGIPAHGRNGETRSITLGGFIIQQMGRVPGAAEYFTWEGYRIEVVDLDGPAIDKVLIAAAAAEPGGSTTAG